MMLRLLLLCGIAALPLAARSADLLLVADEPSLQPLIARLDTPTTETIAAWTLWHGRLAGKDVVLARTEGDPLNAVAATTLAIRHTSPKLVVVFGPARPHDPALHAGDVVVSDKFVAFDGMFSDEKAPGAGSDPLHWERLTHALMTPGEKEKYVDDFPADSAAASRALSLPAPHRGRVVRGILGSAAQVNREADRIAFLHATWHTSSEDAESAFVAGCAGLLATPVVGFRVIDGSPADAAAFALEFVEASK